MRAAGILAVIAAAGFCAGGIGITPAIAQPVDSMLAGTLNLGWTDYQTPDRATENWLAGGSAVLTVDDPGFNVQANFANSAIEIPRSGAAASESADQWTYGGDIFWRDFAGSTGFNANFQTVTSAGNSGAGTEHYDTYGWFGQFFALPDLTLQLKGGRIESANEGWYGDGSAVYYPDPRIALNLTLDYAELQHVRREMKDASFTAEFLPMREVPVSLYIGYDYALYSELTPHHVNVFLVGLKAYLGGGGRNGTLVDYQRNGTTNWDGAPATLIGLGF